MTHQLPPEVRVLTEDDIYRTSSQFRVWSFSPESLAELRAKTHQIAVERIERQRKQGADGVSSSSGKEGEQLDYLTEEEELRLVQRYCDMIRATNDHLNWPANVKVRNLLDRKAHKILTAFAKGHSHTISPPLLPLQLPAHIPAQRNLQNRPLPRQQSRVERMGRLCLRSPNFRKARRDPRV